VSDTPSYLAPVSPAIDALGTIYQAMLEQLDEDHHGFVWWRGYMDDRRLALIAEYLLASVSGVSESLADAAFLTNELGEQLFADETWTRNRIKHAHEAATSGTSVLKALHRSGNDERRGRRIRLAREHVFYHLAQAFDRLAAVVVGVGALKTAIIRADWRLVANDGLWKRSLGDQPERGRGAQSELRRAVLEALQSSGPDDWYRWIDATRNTNAHRAPKINMITLSKEPKGSPPRMIHLFERQPTWSMTEAIVGSQGQTLDEVWILKDPLGLVRGALNSTSSVVETVVELLTALWVQRRADPLLLVQPGAQWPKVLEEPLLNFPGYGDPIRLALQGGQFRVSPDTGKRMRASGIFSPELWS
jgi:hypothetical protein